MYFLILLLTLFQQPEPLNQIHVHKPLELLKLPDKVTLVEEQGGIAGKNCWQWTVETSGDWKFESYRIVTVETPIMTKREKEQDRMVICKGKLTAIKLSSLARSLEENKYETLPAELGSKTINPHCYTLTVGKKSFVCQGIVHRRAGQTISDNIIGMVVGTEDIDRAKHIREYIRFAIIAQTVDFVTEIPRPNKPKDVVVNDKFKEPIRLNVGDELYIQLPVQLKDRHTWNISHNEGVLREGEHKINGPFKGKLDRPVDDKVYEEQIQTFRFTAAKAGEFHLCFRCQRTGTPEPEQKTCTFDIKVK